MPLLHTDSIVATSVVVSGILLAADELLRVEELAVRSSPVTGNVLACTLLI